jgi:Fe-S-cluster formation regulator IscX/YfhJ
MKIQAPKEASEKYVNNTDIKKKKMILTRFSDDPFGACIF